MTLNEELQKNFSEQFATNQNNHQTLFTQILSILLTVIIGYGYVFTAGGKFNSKDIYVNEFLLASTFFISTLIIYFGLVLISNLALGYRRDQFVVYNIRKSNGLVNGQNPNLSIFPESFNPKSSLDQKNIKWEDFKKSWRIIDIIIKVTGVIYLWKFLNHTVSWMPNYHNIHFLVLGLLNCVIFCTFIFNPYDRVTLFEWNLNLEKTYILVSLGWIILNFYIFERVIFFRKRLENLYNGLPYYS